MKVVAVPATDADCDCLICESVREEARRARRGRARPNPCPVRDACPDCGGPLRVGRLGWVAVPGGMARVTALVCEAPCGWRSPEWWEPDAGARAAAGEPRPDALADCDALYDGED